MIRGFDGLRPGAVTAGLCHREILAAFAVCSLLTSANIVSAATLSGRFDNLGGATVNLTEEGTLDWGQWGYETEWSYYHKYGVAQQITYSFITDWADYPMWDGPWLLDGRYGGYTILSWADGMPPAVAGETWNGISIYGDKLQPGNLSTGFRIQCPADTTLKTLRLYLGNSWGHGIITATLNGTTGYADDWPDGHAALDRVYTFDFQADSAGKTLTVEYTCSDPTWYITLQAATLSGPNIPPNVAITAPGTNAAFSAPATFALTASANDLDGTVTNLSLYRGSTLLKKSASGALSLTLSNQPPGAYDFFAVASDNGGLSMTSFPVRVYVIASGGTLNGSVEAAPYYVNLTAEGTADWAHWGLSWPNYFDHKANVAQRIPNVVPLNATAQDLTNYTDNLTTFEWLDGTPTAAAYSSSGLLVWTTNNPPEGFQMTVPAASYLRTLKLYVGLSYVHGKLDAWLSDFSALPYSDASISQSDDNGYGLYTITFASPNAGANLVVTWTPLEVFNSLYGNLTWQAATLTEAASPPVLQAVYPPPAPNGFALSFFARTGASYTVQFVTNLASANWQLLTNFPGNGATRVVGDPALGSSRRFYRVLMQ